MNGLDDALTLRGIKSGTYTTDTGKRQEGVAFVCLEHGLQPFRAFYHPPTYQPAIQLGCGCLFFARNDGEIVKITEDQL